MLAMPLKEAGLYVIYLIHAEEVGSTATESWTSRDNVEMFRKEVLGWEPR